ncbi:aldo/keto reductase [Tabrizicola sp. J26]|uniref:aldo/keto reductase n=1 Tax=Alitabrizicola rongguiensis TaxID=2909234 RepID=UPI001F3B4B5F|nr:aldo/keto reductase [Tabrizicola rongguiensis]MCF1709532.1 aldo/keto reductase [Tabrizicola rongguiensis]
MIRRPLGPSGLTTAPVVFGGNVLGWTVDEPTGFAILDAFVDHGFNAIDTADVYSNWAPGNHGGESETLIGRWLKARPGMRERVTIFTKVGSDLGRPGEKGLSAGWITRAVESSLRRLQTDVIDLYFSHWPDAETPQEETLSAFATLLASGKVRAIGASNLDAGQLRAALELSQKGLPRYQVLQPEYNLYDRASFEGPLQDLCRDQGLGVVTYFSLASGFLSGKYLSEADFAQSVRAEDIAKYLTPRGFAILDALQEVAGRHGAQPSEVALAWVMAQPGVTAPIASATKLAHVTSFARAAELRLTAEDLIRLAL